MYKLTLGRKNFKQQNTRTSFFSRINGGLILLIIIVFIFFLRVGSVLKQCNERGGYAYVQLLNLGMPIVKEQVYNEESYAENNLSLKNVLLKSIGLDGLAYENILKSEVGFFNNIDNSEKTSLTFNQFNVNEESVLKFSSNEKSLNSKIYDPSLKKNLNASKPEVLIYHTHTTENYAEASVDTTDENANVVGVGDALAKELEENYGISVIHDKTNHSVSYNDSYSRSSETVDKYLKKYGDFKIILDLHRDSVDNKDAMTTKVEGTDAAKIMFVNAKNSTRYDKNKELTENIFKKTEELFPGLTRKILTYNRGKNAFNQSKSDGSVLFEMGSNVNSIEEAKVTARCMARVLAEILNK
ncbi:MULTISPECIES: stage II sporulation protein P [Clostridium]|uniref:Stage II sporulation protein P n=1 Tax=Clostridium botulinum TaxID=1491 RepID=A0A6B4S420_CLOBO|nr:MULTISPECIES: stage II sporulation protein P [Clostridium]KIL09088.1 stage II sporulation protein P [Clostridium botulinum]MBN1041239.1 stage II sporulation protein P [Clostridium botulinum]MBN1057721.1 stage II sporulation protein P [Clostridium botulinum]MBN1060966.1 stage II sporulation protein P [Clostridium botulinum]MBY6932780.1 stage II sporulation protein P [Clostridium botulinum]